MQKKTYIRISPDCDVLIIHSDGCCDCAYGDEISNDRQELGPRFSIVMPGIDEWLERYASATDFTETTTDPSFDWKTWHYEGLCFAKAIWNKLPRCYTLYYDPPFEDRSHTVESMIIDEKTDSLIENLKKEASLLPLRPSIQHNIGYEVKRGDNGLGVLFRYNKMTCKVNIPYTRLADVKSWLKEISAGNEDASLLILSEYKVYFFRQSVGLHTDMGELWIVKDSDSLPVFCAYVNIRIFIKGLYLSLMTELGFGLYRNIDDCLSANEIHSIWKPYNELKSLSLEHYISGSESFMEDEPTTNVNETFVMFPDYGGCMFWDTMGAASGDYEVIYSDMGDIKIDVPGLREWQARYESDNDSPFDEYWMEGYKMAKMVRQQLPANIDLYFMCFDPQAPDKIIDYRSDCPRILIPK